MSLQELQDDSPESRGQSLLNDSRWRSSLRRRLTRWFDQNARDLPWRRNPTPYFVWISEIMLQQTQVATVIDYFNRFVLAFPTVTHLSEAEEAELMRLWEGLGYYRRARLMHQAAKQIVAQFGGAFPTDYESVLALPGIGRYTAGAILSISTNAKLPILEGNTVRVYSRWIAMRDDVKSAAGIARLWAVGEAMLPSKEAGRFNQAAMELGALICKPVEPGCDRCPVSANCEAYRLGLQNSIPGKVTRMTYEDRQEYAFVVPEQGRRAWLVYQVPPGERWAGLWDFPRATEGTAKSMEEAARSLSLRIGATLEPRHRLKTIKHAVTRFRITLQVVLAHPVEAGSRLSVAAPYRFMEIDELSRLPLSVTGRKIAKLLAEYETPSLFS
jgi:A/G-specific adenine glycosylase